MNRNIIVSIIIATYNAEKVLQQCLDSIRLQKGEDVELIIIDGASKDNTIDIINNNVDIIDNSISEPDKGIYDAWNKGLSIATGEWIMFLGADDKLFPNVLPQISARIQEIRNSGINTISTKMELFDPRSGIKSIKGEKFDYHKFVNRNLSFAHPATIQKADVFKKYGGFDISYRIVGDAEFYMRAGRYLSADFLNIMTVRMTQGGTSVSFKAIKESYNMRKKYKETNKINNLFGALKMSIILMLHNIRSYITS